MEPRPAFDHPSVRTPQTPPTTAAPRPRGACSACKSGWLKSPSAPSTPAARGGPRCGWRRCQTCGEGRGSAAGAVQPRHGRACSACAGLSRRGTALACPANTRSSGPVQRSRSPRRARACATSSTRAPPAPARLRGAELARRVAGGDPQRLRREVHIAPAHREQLPHAQARKGAGQKQSAVLPVSRGAHERVDLLGRVELDVGALGHGQSLDVGHRVMRQLQTLRARLKMPLSRTTIFCMLRRDSLPSRSCTESQLSIMSVSIRSSGSSPNAGSRCALTTER